MEPAAAAVALDAPAWYAEPCVMGIDEAGRGPVLGAMVYGAAFCPAADVPALGARAFADSKTLTEETRERLFEEIAADPRMGSVVDSLSAAEISAKMLARDVASLNALAMTQTFALIDGALARGANLTACFVDTVGDPERHRERLAQRFPGIAFTVCPKADALYPIVSAASIVAKVTRDRELLAHVHAEGGGIETVYGSGYPADPQTKAWLAKHVEPVFGFPALVRFSWATTKTALEAAGAAPVRWECDEDGGGGQQQLAFGGAVRHSFFRARKLQRVAAGL
jgi:ribonuclease H2 subunit A